MKCRAETSHKVTLELPRLYIDFCSIKPPKIAGVVYVYVGQGGGVIFKLLKLLCVFLDCEHLECF